MRDNSPRRISSSAVGPSVPGETGNAAAVEPSARRKTHTDLGGVGRPHLGVDTHPADDFARSAADVDVLPCVSPLVESLDDGGAPAARRELMGHGGTADTGAGDDSV